MSRHYGTREANKATRAVFVSGLSWISIQIVDLKGNAHASAIPCFVGESRWEESSLTRPNPRFLLVLQRDLI